MIQIKIGSSRMAPKGSVVIILNEKNEILLLKRGSTAPWAPDKWSPPGGQVETNETPKEAAIREAYEETCLKVKDLKKVDLKVDTLCGIYYTSDYVGNVKLDFEHTDWAWVSRDNMGGYDLAPNVLKLYDWVLSND